MFQALDHVGQAVRILVGRNATLHQRLFEAADQFALALQCSESWPADLLQRARQIAKQLTARGRLDTTINAMDSATAGRLAEEIYELAVAIEIAKVQRISAPSPHLPTPSRGRLRRLDLGRSKSC